MACWLRAGIMCLLLNLDPGKERANETKAMTHGAIRVLLVLVAVVVLRRAGIVGAAEPPSLLFATSVVVFIIGRRQRRARAK